MLDGAAHDCKHGGRVPAAAGRARDFEIVATLKAPRPRSDEIVHLYLEFGDGKDASDSPPLPVESTMPSAVYNPSHHRLPKANRYPWSCVRAVRSAETSRSISAVRAHPVGCGSLPDRPHSAPDPSHDDSAYRHWFETNL